MIGGGAPLLIAIGGVFVDVERAIRAIVQVPGRRVQGVVMIRMLETAVGATTRAGKERPSPPGVVTLSVDDEPLPVRKCFLIRFCRRHQPESAPDTGEVDHRFTGDHSMFEVPTQSPIPPQPSQRPLHHPAAGQQRKPFSVWWAAHHLQVPSALLADLRANMRIAAIGPNELEPTPAVVDGAFNAGKECLQHQLTARTIRNARTMDDDQQQQPQHVDHNMALAPRCLLMDIPPARFAALRGLHTLTVDNGGTGLGLSICRRLTELMGGHIWAESTLGSGCTMHVTVRLPHAASEPPASSGTGPRLTGTHILIVDDHETNRLVCRDILARTGASIVEAGDGPAALAAMQKAHTDGKPFHLVILDSRMPEMDGFSVAEAMRGFPELSKTPTIMLTSDVCGGNATNAHALGIRQHLSKPIRSLALLNAVDSTLTEIPQLPLEQTPATVPLAASPEAPHAPARTFATGRILLAEDLEDNRDVVVLFLKNTAYELDMAENGAIALEKFKAGTYDLVFMDMQMPVMDGYVATNRIREWEHEHQRTPTPILAPPP